MNEERPVAIFSESVWNSRANQRRVEGMPLEEAIYRVESLGISAGCVTSGNNGNAVVVAGAPDQLASLRKDMAALGITGAQVVARDRLNHLAPDAFFIEETGGRGAGCR